MKTYKQRNFGPIAFIGILAISTIMVTACTKKSETQSQTTKAEQTQTAVSSDPYPQILNGNLTAFAGTWVDGYGFSGQLRSDGIFDRGGETAAYGFEKNGDGTYSWYVSWGGESMGSYLTLFPPGVEVMDNSYPQQLLLTDTTKVRIADTAKGIGSSDEVFYRQGELPAAQSNSKDPQFVYSVQFNNQTIPITVFYSVSGADGEMMNLDRMVFMYGNKEQAINLSPKVIEAGSPQGFFSYYVIPADYNFDGFLDFAVHHGHYSSWDPDIIYKVFLYSQQTANYSINEELSKLPNVRVNNETQTVISVDGPVTSEYKWVSGKLELIKSESQAFSGPQ